MRKPAYSVTSDNLVDTFTGDQALPSARGTFEKYKSLDRNAVLTSGYLDDITQEYTATHFLDRHVTSKPYTCSDPACGKTLAFPETFFYLNRAYCSEHLPAYDESEQW